MATTERPLAPAKTNTANLLSLFFFGSPKNPFVFPKETYLSFPEKPFLPTPFVLLC